MEQWTYPKRKGNREEEGCVTDTSREGREKLAGTLALHIGEEARKITALHFTS